MTHVAWAPPQWEAAARKTLAGLEERHPSRTILLFPDPKRADGIDVHGRPEVLHDRRVVARGVLGRDRAPPRRRRARRCPARSSQPLLITDLPTFCRWRGLPPWGEPELEQLVDVCDRLVVDSSEWRGLPGAYAELAKLFDRIAVSDIAWGRALGWRGRLAARVAGDQEARDALRDRAEGGRAPARRLAALAAADAGAADPPCRRGARARRGRRRSRSRRRGAGRRPRATCSRPSSTSSAATRSTRRRSKQLR